jgi:hypothetical protein
MTTELEIFLTDCTVDGVTPANEFVDVLLGFCRLPATEGYRREARALLRERGLLLEDAPSFNDRRVSAGPAGFAFIPGQAPAEFGGRVSRALGGRLAVHPITGKYVVR